MEKTLQVLNQMVEDGVLNQYAIGGAVAAVFVEPINTNDLVIFFSATGMDSTLAMLAPLYEYLSAHGYEVQGETIDIEGWPVQFLPVFNPLVEEALEQANVIEFAGTTTRVMRSEHLVAIMLQTGRLKDYARIQQFLEHKVVDQRELSTILKRHSLDGEWRGFQRDYL